MEDGLLNVNEVGSELEDAKQTGSNRIVTNQNIGVVCRGCDFPMSFEEENPRGYFLFICKTGCKTSENVPVRVGLLGVRLDTLNVVAHIGPRKTSLRVVN